MSKHTQGPWEVGDSDTHGVRVRVAQARPHGQSFQLGVSMEVKDRIALCFECSAGAAKANARLIASAPRMYAALMALTTAKHIDLGDLVYHVREHEGEGWDGPAVKEWSAAVTEVTSILKELNQ